MNKLKNFITCFVYIARKTHFYFLFYPHILPHMLLAVWSPYKYYRLELGNLFTPMSQIKKNNKKFLCVLPGTATLGRIRSRGDLQLTIWEKHLQTEWLRLFVVNAAKLFPFETLHFGRSKLFQNLTVGAEIFHVCFPKECQHKLSSCFQ